jgi:hypothetical protein
VERWNALAGYRGLSDPAVRRHFNNTFLAFEADGWGPNQELMTNLDLRYDVAYLGADAASEVLRDKLAAGFPAFFFLWSPHELNARFHLNRIQLPAYVPALFQRGLSDFPFDVVEKIAAKTFSELFPEVAELYSRFQIDNSAQESMLAAIDSGLSALQATCAWMQNEENSAIWGAWLPIAAKLACDAGTYAVNESTCLPCPSGSGSIGGAVSACTLCSAGMASSAESPPTARREHCLERLLACRLGARAPLSAFPCEQGSSNPKLASLAASTATFFLETSIKSNPLKRPARPARLTRVGTSAFSAPQIEARASAWKVRAASGACGNGCTGMCKLGLGSQPCS